MARQGEKAIKNEAQKKIEIMASSLGKSTLEYLYLK